MSKEIIVGRAWKYGDNINTDIISPPQYMELTIEEAAPYAMSTIDPNFTTKFKEGDILVAGDNFGSGSSRETSPLTLKHLKVKTIIAKTFARIFYRNSINVGILAIECDSTHRIRDEDKLEINLIEGKIKNLTRNEEYQSSKIPEHLMPIIDKGGLVNYLMEL